MTTVLIRARRNADTEEKTMQRWRLKIWVMLQQAKEAWSYQRGKRQERILPQSPQRKPGPIQPWFETWNLQNCERIFCCLWYFFLWQPQETNAGIIKCEKCYFRTNGYIGCYFCHWDSQPTTQPWAVGQNCFWSKKMEVKYMQGSG